MAETIIGGYYIGIDGKPHNAEGKPIPERKQEKPEQPETQAPKEEKPKAK